jgi:hypothetical protein
MTSFFCKFLREALDVDNDTITIRIMCYTNNGITQEEIESFWLNKLNLPATSLRKTTVNVQPQSGQQRGRKLPCGVCTLHVIRSTRHLQHIYGAIQEYTGIDKPDWLL